MAAKTPTDKATKPEGQMSVGLEGERDEWVRAHVDEAASAVIEFLAADNLSLTGKEVADVGCGDGLTDLGIALKANPKMLRGFDIKPTDREALAREASDHGVTEALPTNLDFVTSTPSGIPAPDNSFDFVLTWSAFEHVEEPISLLAEMQRILRPNGILFLQLWPFYHSQHGSHLERWFSGFEHLTNSQLEVIRHITANPEPNEKWARSRAVDFQELNRITPDELQRCLLATGFTTTKLEIISHTIRMDKILQRYSFSTLAAAGIKLLAVPNHPLPEN